MTGLADALRTLLSIEEGQHLFLEMLDSATSGAAPDPPSDASSGSAGREEPLWAEVKRRAEEVLAHVARLQSQLSDHSTGLFIVHKFTQYRALENELATRVRILSTFVQLAESMTHDPAPQLSKAEWRHYRQLWSTYGDLHTKIYERERAVSDYAAHLSSYEGCQASITQDAGAADASHAP